MGLDYLYPSYHLSSKTKSEEALILSRSAASFLTERRVLNRVLLTPDHGLGRPQKRRDRIAGLFMVSTPPSGRMDDQPRFSCYETGSRLHENKDNDVFRL